MWTYEKKLQYPVNIKNPNPKLAQVIISQLGGPDGELGASMRYLSQRFTASQGEVIGTLTMTRTGADQYTVTAITGKIIDGTVTSCLSVGSIFTAKG